MALTTVKRLAAGHPLIATVQVFLPPGETAWPTANTGTDDWSVIARYGDVVGVCEVYKDWNGIPGLLMTCVYVPSTGHYTYFSLEELGLTEEKEESP